MACPRLIRAIISAIDGMLDAEKEQQLQQRPRKMPLLPAQEASAGGNLPNFTATFSFGVCAAAWCLMW